MESPKWSFLHLAARPLLFPAAAETLGVHTFSLLMALLIVQLRGAAAVATLRRPGRGEERTEQSWGSGLGSFGRFSGR